MNEQRIEELTRRVVRLERQNRRLQWYPILIVVLGAIVVLSPVRQRQVEKVVEAEEFVLRDGHGRRRAELSIEAGDPGLVLFDKDGQERANLCVMLGEPTLTLRGEDGESRAILRLMALPSSEKGEPRLIFQSKRGELRATLGLKEGEPVLGLFDRAGRAVFSAP